MATKVTLLKVERELRPSLQVKGKPKRFRKVWTMRWRSSNGTHHSKAIGDCKKITKREAEKVR